MIFKQTEDGVYESQLIAYKDYSKGLEDTIQQIHDFAGVKVNALAALIKGNNHDESFVRVYYVFEPGMWLNFLEAESKRREKLYVATPIVNMNQTFEPSLINKWANYNYDDKIRKVYIEFNGEAKIITINFFLKLVFNYPDSEEREKAKLQFPERYAFRISVESISEQQMEDLIHTEANFML